MSVLVHIDLSPMLLSWKHGHEWTSVVEECIFSPSGGPEKVFSHNPCWRETPWGLHHCSKRCFTKAWHSVPIAEKSCCEGRSSQIISGLHFIHVFETHNLTHHEFWTCRLTHKGPPGCEQKSHVWEVIWVSRRPLQPHVPRKRGQNVVIIHDFQHLWGFLGTEPLQMPRINLCRVYQLQRSNGGRKMYIHAFVDHLENKMLD